MAGRAEAMADKMNARALSRETEIRSIYDQLLDRYKPGGAASQRAQTLFESERIKGVGAKTHALMSKGLANTTLDPGAVWMSETGNVLKAKLEDLTESRYADIARQKAGFIERIQDVGPDPSAVGGYAQQIANVPSYSAPATQAVPASRSTPMWGQMQSYARRKAGSGKTYGPVGGGFSATRYRTTADPDPKRAGKSLPMGRGLGTYVGRGR
jgi:hypothetical protein